MPASNDNLRTNERPALWLMIFGPGLWLSVLATGFGLWATWQ